jgi:putative restriction endonuclease
MVTSSIACGEVPGISVGAVFRDRRAVREAGLHRPLQAGIDFAPGQPAASVVLSGVYPDEDEGDVVIYTGQGGLIPGTSTAVADQKPILGNAALIRNRNSGIPVRVIRRIPGGFRYDGLYSVDRYFRERPASDGFLRWRYELRALLATGVLVLREGRDAPERVDQTVQRIVRDTAVTRAVKLLYQYTCQFCDIALPTPVAPYAEAAHIRPLGRPHNGRDAIDNVLCLCPNDHVLFDFGAITVLPETLTITGERSLEGHALNVSPRHHLNVDHFDYHREAIFVPIIERPDW